MLTLQDCVNQDLGERRSWSELMAQGGKLTLRQVRYRYKKVKGKPRAYNAKVPIAKRLDTPAKIMYNKFLTGNI